MEKRLLILEGPAGSGKSYMVDRLVDLTTGAVGTYSVRSSMFPREPDAEEIIHQSLLNDTLKIFEAMRSDEPAVVDRLFGQRVYGRLRGGEPPSFSINWFERLLRFVNLVTSEISWRSGVHPGIPVSRRYTLRVLWVMLTPDLMTLTAQREKAGREYPWSATQELKEYVRWSEELSRDAGSISRCSFHVGTSNNWLTQQQCVEFLLGSEDDDVCHPPLP